MADPDPQQPTAPSYVSTDPNAAKVTYLSTDPNAASMALPNLSPQAQPLVATAVAQAVKGFNPVPAVKVAFGGPSGDPAQNIAQAIVAASAERLRAARAAMANGDHAAAAMHYVGAIPLIGGPIDDLVTALRNNDQQGAARAMGNAAALVLPTVLSGGADAAAEAASTPAVANLAQAAAESKIADALAPQNGWGRSVAGKKFAAMADDVAPAVLAAGPKSATRSSLGDFVDSQAQAASAAWAAAEAQRIQGHVAPTAPLIPQLQAKIDSLTQQPVPGSLPQRVPVTTTSPLLDANGNPIQTTTLQAQPIGQPVPPTNQAARVAVLQQAIAKLKQLGPIARFEDLRTGRVDADAGSDYSPSIATPSDQNSAAEQSALGNRDVAGVYRDAMVSIEPQMAPANANYSIWQKAQDVVQAAEDVNRTATKGGSFASTIRMLPAVLGAGAGAAAGGVEGSIIGSAGGTFLTAALDAASKAGLTTKVATARVLDTLASAIRTGNAPIVARSLASLAAVTGTTVPAINQSLATPSGLNIQVPQAPINVALNAPGGGGS